MALGSSAPEILLSIIELPLGARVFFHGFSFFFLGINEEASNPVTKGILRSLSVDFVAEL